MRASSPPDCSAAQRNRQCGAPACKRWRRTGCHLLARSRRHRVLHRCRTWICRLCGADRVRGHQREASPRGDRDKAARPSRIKRRIITCVDPADLFCWPVASLHSARRRPLLGSCASQFCRSGKLAPPRRVTCKGHGPASWSPMHRVVQPCPGHSKSNSPASRNTHLTWGSLSVSCGLPGKPNCR